MKILFTVVFCSICIVHCFAQVIAMAPTRMVKPAFKFETITGEGVKHRQSALGSAGTYCMLGGVVAGIAGYIEVKGATKTDGPFTITDESKVNTGRDIEIAGGAVFTAGLIMVIINAVDNHSKRETAIHIIAPKSNELGIAYKF